MSAVGRYYDELATAPFDHVTRLGAESIFAQSQDRLRSRSAADRATVRSIAVQHRAERAGYGSEHIGSVEPADTVATPPTE